MSWIPSDIYSEIMNGSNTYTVGGNGAGLIGTIGNIASSALGAIGSEGHSMQNSSGSSWGNGNGHSISSTMGTGNQAMQFEDAQAKRAMEFSALEAQKNREFQLGMSNTAFQRAVEDMKKAGINPILAAGTQASTGSGSMASGFKGSGHTDSYSESIQNSVQGSISSAYGFSNFASGIQSLINGLEEMERAKKGRNFNGGKTPGQGSGRKNTSELGKTVKQAVSKISKKMNNSARLMIK